MKQHSNNYLGYIGIFSALTIWTSWMILTRVASLTNLSSLDLSALRFLVAGGLLLPFAIIRLRKKLFSKPLLVLSALMGAPYMILVATGIHHSSAAHAATFINGSMVLTSVIFASILLQNKIRPHIFGAIAVIILGLAILGGVTELKTGDIFFVVAGGMWAVYSVFLQKWKVKAFDAVLAVNFWSLIVFAIPYTLLNPEFLSETPILHLVGHGFFQGVLTSIAAHVFFATAVQHLGAAKVSLFVPLVPVLTGFVGIAFLQEHLSTQEWLGILFVTSGILATKINWQKIRAFKTRASKLKDDVVKSTNGSKLCATK